MLTKYHIDDHICLFVGQERFTSMTRVYYKDARACIIMFDLSQRSTFLNALKWKNDLDSKCTLPDGSPVPCILLANKVRHVVQNNRPFAWFANNSLRCIFLNKNVWILNEISLRCVPKGINFDNKSALVQVMAKCQIGNKPLPKPMLTKMSWLQIASVVCIILNFQTYFSEWCLEHILCNCSFDMNATGWLHWC